MALDSPMSVSFRGNQKLETNCQLNGSSGIDFSALSEIAGENSDRAGHLHLSRPETSSAAGTVIVDSYPIPESCANLSAAKICAAACRPRLWHGSYLWYFSDDKSQWLAGVASQRKAETV